VPERKTVWDYNEMGVFFYSRGAYDLAISEFRQALAASLIPHAAIHVNLGAALLGRGLHAEAETSLRRGLALDPHSVRGHMTLGRLLSRLGRLPEALEAFERARALAGDSRDAVRAAEEIRHLQTLLHH
jgi:tetratricopeptide (TPR) repeat protein